jgi:branched-chain amino acid transport system ATP-binding protein
MVNVFSGFQRPTAGTVRMGNIVLSKMSAPDVAKAGIARSFQAGRLFRELTVLENLVVPGISTGLKQRDAEKRAYAILERVGLSDMADTVSSSLTYGNERRVGIARALALDPAFLLLDEPASGMNDAECAALVDVIASIPAEFGCGVMLIEHNMDVVMRVCSRIQVMDGGRTLVCGTPLEVQQNADVKRAYLGSKSGEVK